MTEIISRKDAIHQGRKRYFTGKVCNQGHLDHRYVQGGACVECNRLRLGSLRLRDPELIRARQREWWASQPLEKRRASSAWQLANPDRVKENKRQWVINNAGRVATNKHSWAVENAERVAANRRSWAAECSERVAMNKRLWRERNLAKHREQNRIVQRRRRAISYAAEGDHTVDDIAAIRSSQGDRCIYCQMPLHGRGHEVAFGNICSGHPANYGWPQYHQPYDHPQRHRR